MRQADQFPTANHSRATGPYRRRVIRPLTLTAPLALLLLVSACGSSTDTPKASDPVKTTDSATTTEPAPAGGAGTELTATVGEEGSPDAFKITLKDSAGAEVTTLKAGSYDIKVKDLSKIHNFHLTGTGVEEKTTVPEVKDVTWKVTLAAGSYTYKCDPHAKMTGSFTVT